MEAELALVYRHRSEGRRLTMYHQGVECPESDLELMEAYLEELEQRTGRKVEVPIYWVRGKLLGMGMLSMYGLALGSTNSWSVVKDGKPLVMLTNSAALGEFALDRHEVAHAVMAQWQPASAEPPTILSEGWANYCGWDFFSGDPFLLQSMVDADALLRAGQVLSTLFGPDWYHQDSGPVYLVGQCLVGLLIERHGFARFFELYATIAPDKMEETFMRIYGISLAALEKEFWAYVKPGRGIGDED